MALRFNPPPNWPAPPPGFVPPPRWQPDPSWPPPPAGWELWVPDDDTDPGNGSFQRRATGPNPRVTGPNPRVTGPNPRVTGPNPRVTEPPEWARDFATGPGDFGTGPGDFATGPGDFGAGPGDFGTELGDFPAGLEDFPGDHGEPNGYADFPGDPDGPGDFTGMAPTQAYQPRGPQGPRGARPGPGPGQPGRGRRGGRRRRVLIAGSVLAVLVIAAVLYIVMQGSPKPKAPSATGSHSPVPTPTASGNNNQLTNVFSLQAGQCFQNPPASQTVLGITYVAVVPCTTEHNAQVFVQFPAKGTSYPGSSALRQQSDSGCHKQISKTVQKSKITNSMTLRYLYPLPSSWADGHRLITCLIVDAKPDLKDSLLRTHSGH